MENTQLDIIEKFKLEVKVDADNGTKVCNVKYGKLLLLTNDDFKTLLTGTDVVIESNHIGQNYINKRKAELNI